MKLIIIKLFLLINLFSFDIFSKNIAVVNIQLLIDNNKLYNSIIKDIESSQDKYLKTFQFKENELKLKFKDIEDSKLILSENEIDIQIKDYNNQLSEFQILIDEFNFHYQNQVVNIRESLLKEILILLEQYAKQNSVDLILDSTSYLIASNTLDITNDINNELEKIDFKLEYKDFDAN